MWNGSQVELLVPLNGDPESPIAKWMAGNGGKGGIQHVALRVDNLAAAIEELQEKGVKMIDKAPRRGAGGANIAFIHPKSTGGILLELCQLCDA